MEWTNANVRQLIELYREHEVLWNVTTSDFKNQSKKHDAWTTIAKYFQINGDEIEKKMRCLVGQFQREQKKPTSGAGTDEARESKWFKSLKFLKYKHKSRLTPGAGTKVSF